MEKLTTLERAKYALFATAVASAIISLIVLLLDRERLELVFSPLTGGAIFVITYLFAPALSARVPLTRSRKS